MVRGKMKWFHIKSILFSHVVQFNSHRVHYTLSLCPIYSYIMYIIEYHSNKHDKSTQCLTNVGHRLRRWPNIGQTLDRCVVLTETFTDDTLPG